MARHTFFSYIFAQCLFHVAEEGFGKESMPFEMESPAFSIQYRTAFRFPTDCPTRAAEGCGTGANTSYFLHRALESCEEGVMTALGPACLCPGMDHHLLRHNVETAWKVS